MASAHGGAGGIAGIAGAGGFFFPRGTSKKYCTSLWILPVPHPSTVTVTIEVLLLKKKIINKPLIHLKDLRCAWWDFPAAVEGWGPREQPASPPPMPCLSLLYPSKALLYGACFFLGNRSFGVMVQSALPLQWSLEEVCIPIKWKGFLFVFL